MINPAIRTERNGRIHVNGSATPYYVESGTIDDGRVWYLQHYGRAHRQFAWHKRRRDVLQAASVFIEGATARPEESESEMVNRALQLCLETGSRNIVNLTGELRT